MQLVKMTTKVLGMSATCPTPITILPRRGGSQHGTSLRPKVEAGREGDGAYDAEGGKEVMTRADKQSAPPQPRCYLPLSALYQPLSV
jgi:hypothetical protein